MGKAGQARCVHRTFGKRTKAKSAGKASKAATPPKLKQGLSPGSVLILLAGRFRGRRVVFLKQLGSGLLLVTGPYAVNGVPLRRVNQRFCIATSAKVDLKGADVSKVTDEYFARDKGGKSKGMVMMPPFMKGGFGGWGGGKGGGKGWGAGGGGFKVRDENAPSTVWLGNLPEGISQEEVKTNFEAAGTVKKIQLIKQGKEGFAWFSTPEEAQTAIAMFNGAQINGQAIVVDPWTRKAK